MGNWVNQDGSAARVPSFFRYFITSPSHSPLTLSPSHPLALTLSHSLTLSHPLTPSLTFTPSHTLSPSPHSRTHTLTLSSLSFPSSPSIAFFYSPLSPVNLSTVSVFFETVLAVSPVCLYAPWFEYLAS